MTINYTLSAIMKMAHSKANKLRSKCNTYLEALSKGLKESWKIAKGLITNVIAEDSSVIVKDVIESWCHELLGNIDRKDCLVDV